MNCNWNKIKRYYEAWWKCEVLDKVPLWIVTPCEESREKRTQVSTIEERLFNKEKVIEQAKENMKSTFYGGLYFSMQL